MIIDSHAHLGEDPVFLEIESIMDRARKAGIDKIVDICTDTITLQRGLSLVKVYPEILLAGAVTPHDEGDNEEGFFTELQNAVAEKKLIAIGETGLDYHRVKTPRSVQKERLLHHVRLAICAGLPLIFHCREAFSDLFSYVDAENFGNGVLLHCFTGTKEEAREVLNRGWKISFSGIVTFKKSSALREILAYVPFDSILVETDTPYLAPESNRGRVNEPSFLPETIRMIADCKGVSEEEARSITANNARLFFSF